MSRRFTFCEDATILGWHLSVGDDNNDKDMKFLTVRNGEDGEEVGDDDEEVAVDNERDIKVFEERGNNDAYDDRASSDEDVSSQQVDKENRTFVYIPS